MQLDDIKTLCFNDASEFFDALADLEVASRHFIAIVHAPGKLGRSQWADEQKALRAASRTFLASLHDLSRQLRQGTREQRDALLPQTLLGAPFAALEALYEEVVARRRKHVARIARHVD